MKKYILGLFAVLLTGCASMPEPQYVSVNNYQHYNCQQLTNEFNRTTQYINANANKNTGLQASGVGIGLGIGRGGIYPSISVGLGTINRASNRNNLAIAMGERDAIVQSGKLKNCAFSQNVPLYGSKSSIN